MALYFFYISDVVQKLYPCDIALKRQVAFLWIISHDRASGIGWAEILGRVMLLQPLVGNSITNGGAGYCMSGICNEELMEEVGGEPDKER